MELGDSESKQNKFNFEIREQNSKRSDLIWKGLMMTFRDILNKYINSSNKYQQKKLKNIFQNQRGVTL